MSQTERVPADQYRTVVTRPDDFDAFWDGLELLAQSAESHSAERDGGVGAVTQYTRD